MMMDFGRYKKTAYTVNRFVNLSVLFIILLWLLIIPFFSITCNLGDPGLKSEGIPRFAWKLHKNLTPKYEEWAKKRIKSGKAPIRLLSCIRKVPSWCSYALMLIEMGFS